MINTIVSAIDVTAEPVCGFYQARAEFEQPKPVGRRNFLLSVGIAYGSGGSGSVAAKRSTAEALERYSLAWHGDEPEVLARYKTLDGALHPAEILKFSERQYARRTVCAPESRDWVPAQFDESAECAWTEVRDMIGGGRRWALSSLCYLWSDCLPGSYAIADTNGCAAGMTDDECHFRGLMELIERDAVAIWWYNRVRRPGIPAEEFQSEKVTAAVKGLSGIGRVAWFLDITTDLGVPVIAAVIPRADGSQPFFGAAANPSPTVAAERAVAEAVQFAFWSQVDPAPEIERANTKASFWLQPHGWGGVPKELGGLATGGNVISFLGLQGLHVFGLNVTRAQARMPVWRMIVPGLRHPWSRFAPGRLYEAPVRLGWLRSPLPEDELNAWNCPL